VTSIQQIKRAPGVGFAVVSLCLVQFVDVLGVTVVVTALAAMLACLHVPESYPSRPRRIRLRMSLYLSAGSYPPAGPAVAGAWDSNCASRGCSPEVAACCR